MLHFKGSNLIRYNCIISENPCEGGGCLHPIVQGAYRRDGEVITFQLANSKVQQSSFCGPLLEIGFKICLKNGELLDITKITNLSANNNSYITVPSISVACIYTTRDTSASKPDP